MNSCSSDRPEINVPPNNSGLNLRRYKSLRPAESYNYYFQKQKNATHKLRQRRLHRRHDIRQRRPGRDQPASVREHVRVCLSGRQHPRRECRRSLETGQHSEDQELLLSCPLRMQVWPRARGRVHAAVDH